MITEKIVSFFTTIFGGFFSLFNLPSFPSELINSVKSFLDYLFSNASLLGLFVRIDTLKIASGLLIIIINFEKLYNLGKWLISKIPFLNK
jgi:hypothetical protein